MTEWQFDRISIYDIYLFIIKHFQILVNISIEIDTHGHFEMTLVVPFMSWYAWNKN